MTLQLIDEVKQFKKKAEQNRQMHFSISRRANFLNRTLHAMVLIGSSATAILTFAEYSTFIPWFPLLKDDDYKLFIGLVAGGVFIISILEEYFRLGEKAVSHETIAKQLTSFIRSASVIEALEEISKEDVEKIDNDYSRIHENAPTIPDKVFIKEKQRLKIKIDISKKLESTPHMSTLFYRIKMKFKQLSGYVDSVSDE
ncbi:hypothetical protein [Paenibacillus odorifer]|uniref:SMODS and SLOG-associating 2TM effector domain-containing protein n=1 Tax=Paenibacillus odorifer TaxID=189426 RepID=A0A1R0Y9K7_9BACL|nr:hypothetical protein [Paenibacillus odorifer]OMD44050.1 hypothetical protein BSK52_00425 [Paenibacillus odorifer]